MFTIKKKNFSLYVCVQLIFILLLITSVQAENLYAYDSLELQQTIENTVEIEQTENDFILQEFQVTYALQAITDFRQQRETYEYIPSPEKHTQDEIVFLWSRPKLNTLTMYSKETITTSAKPVEIQNKISFPLTHIPYDVHTYIQPTTHIDINDEIYNLATELAQGHDDLFILQHTLAEWVNQNVEYSLSTLTEEANYPSSWVLENRYGVCDEITNLFISLNRALGIPARFVSGIAYTTSELFSEPWGNHGWAEVYFPSVGWVPYDVTYKQYGYVDATHIALAKNVDGNSPSVHYLAKGRSFNFEPSPLNFKTEVLKKGTILEENVEIDVEIKEEAVGFGSYNLITVSLQNKHPYYITSVLQLAKTNGLDFLSPLEQSVVLHPYEEKKIYVLVQITQTLNDGYYYEFPISVYVDGRAHHIWFTVDNKHVFYSKSTMEQYIPSQISQQEVDFKTNCNAESEYLYEDLAELRCSIQTENPRYPYKLCLDDSCQQIRVSDDVVTFTLNTSQLGVQTIAIRSSRFMDTHEQFFTYLVSDIPSLEIREAHITPTTRFNETATIFFILKKTSFASPTDITVTIYHPLLEKEFEIDYDQSKYNFTIDILGQYLTPKENIFTIQVTYTSDGNVVVLEQNLTTQLETDSVLEMGNAYMNTIAGTFDTLTTKIMSVVFGEQEPTQQTKDTLQIVVILITLGIISSVLHFVISSARKSHYK